MPWWTWLLMSIIGSYLLMGILLLAAVGAGVWFFARREGRKATRRYRKGNDHGRNRSDFEAPERSRTH